MKFVMERPTRNGARKQPSRFADFVGNDSGQGLGRRVDAVNVGRGGRGGCAGRGRRGGCVGRGVAKGPTRQTALATTGQIGKFYNLIIYVAIK